ncbi:uncharacterized protein LY89DRAFT_764104 [Mollisia scopiformis]|uniref:ER transporter 6TM N-terminal domain-containing protein n=1 Tax=Mollisia scopiformis TaxID=149040 RepID=A0A132B8N7_MOLSC|nr:uncharacterized protein LY89DRAFT_764104 [Mollisia scopiformis]KUJ08768.1 hypothetical protein LY89DRAFT_764104 [Mollisia scopiformis]
MTELPADDHGGLESKAPSAWKRMAAKLGLNLPMVLLMCKGAIAPTIGIAIYQNSSVAAHYSTIGYLIPIMSILTVPIMPRARFLQNLIITSLLVCLAAALSLLAMWVGVKARENTTHAAESSKSTGPVPGALISPYNAAASVNMAVWFFFMVWLANTFRAYRPQYFLPSILFGIFINVTGSYGPLFSLMVECEALVSRLLETFFSGFAISFAVNLFIVPFTSRNLVSMFVTHEIQGFKAVFQAHTQYMLSLPSRDWYGSKQGSVESEASKDDDPFTRPTQWPEADALKKAATMVTELQVKMIAELRYAKREADWSKLSPDDYGTLVRLCKNILLPILGMESLTEVTDRLEKRGGWSSIRSPNDNALSEKEFGTLEAKEKEQWHVIFEQLHEPILELQKTMAEGLDHSLYQLELVKKPKVAVRGDVEASAEDNGPGRKGFAKRLETGIEQFLKQREGPLREWCAEKGMDHSTERDSMKPNHYPLHQRHQSQLYLILDLEYSFLMAARAILDLVKFADSKVEDGTMAQNRLILPSWRRIKKWIIASYTREDSNLDYHSYSTRSGTPTVYLHDALQSDQDPEHLPPVTLWERSTEKLRGITHFISSAESAFGFRVAAATMCIMIVVYLRNSQQFFIEQRLVWGSIMVAISMTQTAGSGIYGQFVRFGGTALAMVASYIDWYIVNQHTAGIIVFLGITMFLYHYPMIRWQDEPVVPMIGMVTVVLIVGYELQVKQIGVALSTSNGQVFHPLYELAPYRLAAVLGGVGVAFFFTYFPSTITSRNQLRTDLGSSIYLLSNYYSCVYQTVSLRIRSAEGDPDDKQSPGRKLEKARTRLFAKELILLQSMKHHTAFAAWEPSFGGRFPRTSYDKLINHTQNIIHFTTMISYVTETFSSLPSRTTQPQNSTSSSEEWLHDFKLLVSTLRLTSQNVTSLLSIIAAAISSGKPLPPYLKAPEPVHIGQMLIGLDPDILSTRHVFEPAYAAFAVMQVAITMLGDDLVGMLDEAKKLVGEVNYGVDVLGIQSLEPSADSSQVKVGVKQD